MSKFWAAIAVILVLVGGGWFYLHNSKTANPPAQNSTSTTVVYSNTAYGFSIKLPPDWQGYTVENKTWTGQVMKNGQDAARDDGPIISISAPVAANDQQNIPVMIFTQDQWRLVVAEYGSDFTGAASTSTQSMSVGAAPIPPSKLGENSKYVFAIPARYNYAFPPGYEKTDAIVNDKSAWLFFEPAGISFISPKSGDVWNVGQTYRVSWMGGGDHVALFLIDKKLAQTVGQSVSIAERFYNISNTGSYSYTVKSGLSGTYSWSITDLVQNATSSFFTIK